MSSNNPPKDTQSGIPKPSSFGASGQSATRGARTIPRPTAKTSEAPTRSSVSAAGNPQPQPPPQSQPQAAPAAMKPPQKPTEPVPPDWSDLEAKYKQDIEALTESAEMATIEKEIAEEKLDTCERELQELKDRLTEATLQIDMLKGEQQSDRSVGAGTSESSVTVLQLQKVEEQNELLKQALIKLRDISTKDKKALEDLQIDNEELQVKVLDLVEKEHRYLEQIKNFEEQIDVNQSAQEMVEKLTQQKADLEDKLKEMIEDFDCMEKLRDLNEQLLESARETEIELTGKIDMLSVQCKELTNKKRDLEDYLSDQERTMTKLKEENRQLNEHVARLKDQFKESESIEQQKHQIENVAYKLNFSESKMAEKEAEIARYKRNLSELEEQMNNLSSITKEQSARFDELKMQYDSKLSENSELQRALKKKMEEVSELEIRKDMTEKKLQSIQKDKESKIASLTRTIETMKGIEIQHEEEMKRLMEDIEILERERRDLKDQLRDQKSNKSLERTMQTANVSMVTAHDSLGELGISFHATSSPIQSQQVSSLQQSQINFNLPSQQSPHNSMLLNQPITRTNNNLEVSRRLFVGPSSEVDETIYIGKIKELSSAFDKVSRKNYELEMELALHELNNNKVPPYNGASLSSVYNIDRVKSLRSEVNKLKREIRASIINQQICTKSRNIMSQSRAEQFNISRLAMKCQALENEANNLMSNSSLTRSSQPIVPLLQSTPVK